MLPGPALRINIAIRCLIVTESGIKTRSRSGGTERVLTTQGSVCPSSVVSSHISVGADTNPMITIW